MPTQRTERQRAHGAPYGPITSGRDQKDATAMTATRSIATILSIALLCACNQQSPSTTQETAAPKPAAEAGVAHPDLWPKAASPDFKDAETEAFVSELMAKMSLEEKVGQMIQG